MSTQTTTVSTNRVLTLTPEQYTNAICELEEIVQTHSDLQDPLSEKLAAWGKGLIQDYKNLTETHSFSVLNTPEVQDEAVSRIEELKNMILLSTRGQAIHNPVIDEANQIWEESEIAHRNVNNNSEQHPTGATRPHLFLKAMTAWLKSLQPNRPRVLRLYGTERVMSSPSNRVSHPTMVSNSSSFVSFPAFGSLDPQIMNYLNNTFRQLNLVQQQAMESNQHLNEQLTAANQHIVETTEETQRQIEHWKQELETISERVTETEARVEELEEELEEKETEIEELTEQVEELTEQLQKAQEQLSQQNQEISVLRQKAARLTLKCAQLGEKLNKVGKDKKKKKCEVM